MKITVKNVAKTLFFFISAFFGINSAFSQNKDYPEDIFYQPSGFNLELEHNETNLIPEDIKQQLVYIKLFTESYPDITFKGIYKADINDWLISVKVPGLSGSKDFYWCKGSLLPLDKYENKENYWSLLYPYPKKLEDPADFSEEKKEALRLYGSSSNRRNQAGTPMYFFDYIYDAPNQRTIESHLTRTTFLGKPIHIHKRIQEPLKRVEERINSLCKTDSVTADFVKGIKSTDAYHWRVIAGTDRKSFHSLGIAIDIVPKYYGGEAFWSWAKDHNPSGWMLTPLRRRWLPPEEFVKAFEAEGFIWGGKWELWDNMHFEYHPELLNQSTEAEFE